MKVRVVAGAEYLREISVPIGDQRNDEQARKVRPASEKFI
jgi:hypothetical protein